MDRLGKFRPGAERLGKAGTVRWVLDRFGGARRSLVRQGRRGEARYVGACWVAGPEWRGRCGKDWWRRDGFGEVRRGWRGEVKTGVWGTARRGESWSGLERNGKAGEEVKCASGDGTSSVRRRQGGTWTNEGRDSIFGTSHHSQ